MTTRTEVEVGPRERARALGVSCLNDAELLALVLGTGRRGESISVLSASFLDECGGLSGLSRLGPGGFAARAGIGPAKGMRVAAAFELGRRAREVSGPSYRLSDGDAVAAWARPHLADLDHEELWVLALDGNQHLRAARRVAVGGLHGMAVTPSDPLRAAIREGASCMVLVHNHPSGDPTPSREDLAFTLRIEQAALAVGIVLADHVVIARRGHVSFLNHGLLGAAKPSEDEDEVLSDVRARARGT